MSTICFSKFPHLRIGLPDFDAGEYSKININPEYCYKNIWYALITFSIKNNDGIKNITHTVVVERKTVIDNKICYTCYTNENSIIVLLDEKCHYGILNHVINSKKEQKMLLDAFIEFSNNY